jgi:hypothetical protein
MKLKFYIVLAITFLTFSCSVDNNDGLEMDEARVVQIFQWHLVNVSGGFQGVDLDFEMDTVVWIFNIDAAGSGTLIIDNNNTDTDAEDGLDTGSYSVSIPVYDTQSILLVDGNEFGGLLTPTEDDLIVNQNITSEGTGNDGFVYTFKRKIITQDL